MKVAIVGAGVSGLTAAYALRRDHEVRLFDGERAGRRPRQDGRRRDRPAGRSRSTRGSSSTTSTTYPHFMGLLAELGVRDPAERHVARLGLPGVRRRVQLARRRAAASRTPRAVGRARPTGGCSPTSCGSTAMPRERLDAPGRRGRPSATSSTTAATGAAFRDHFLVPITSAVWSTAPDRILDFPVDYLLRFLDNHGLIGCRRGAPVADDPGRLDALRGPDRRGAAGRDASAPATRSRPWRATPTDVTVRTADGAGERFDAVVMATHADDALRPAPRCRRARARRARRLRVLDEPGRAPHRRAASCRGAPRRVGVVERRPGRCAPTRATRSR